MGRAFNLCFRKISNGFEEQETTPNCTAWAAAICCENLNAMEQKLDPLQFFCIHSLQDVRGIANFSRSIIENFSSG